MMLYKKTSETIFSIGKAKNQENLYIFCFCCGLSDFSRTIFYIKKIVHFIVYMIQRKKYGNIIIIFLC